MLQLNYFKYINFIFYPLRLLISNFKLYKSNFQINFIICGAQRSGSSGLYYYLKNHPEIELGNSKNDDQPNRKYGINFSRFCLHLFSPNSIDYSQDNRNYKRHNDVVETVLEGGFRNKKPPIGEVYCIPD